VLEVSHVNYLVGRSDDLAAFYQELQHDSSRKTVVVHGLGGMGKTQLALVYAQRYKHEYSAVFWVNSKSKDTIS
jgi:shikimate 5-dehydrogenase